MGEIKLTKKEKAEKEKLEKMYKSEFANLSPAFKKEFLARIDKIIVESNNIDHILFFEVLIQALEQKSVKKEKPIEYLEEGDPGFPPEIDCCGQ